jgi:hypothetical protein
MTARIRQPGQDRKERGQPETREPEQDNQNSTARIGQSETGHLKRGGKSTTGRQHRQNMTGRTRQAEHARQNMPGSTRQAEHARQSRTGKTGLPGKDCMGISPFTIYFFSYISPPRYISLTVQKYKCVHTICVTYTMCFVDNFRKYVY